MKATDLPYQRKVTILHIFLAALIRGFQPVNIYSRHRRLLTQRSIPTKVGLVRYKVRRGEDHFSPAAVDLEVFKSGDRWISSRCEQIIHAITIRRKDRRHIDRTRQQDPDMKLIGIQTSFIIDGK